METGRNVPGRVWNRGVVSEKILDTRGIYSGQKTVSAWIVVTIHQFWPFAYFLRARCLNGIRMIQDFSRPPMGASTWVWHGLDHLVLHALSVFRFYEILWDFYDRWVLVSEIRLMWAATVAPVAHRRCLRADHVPRKIGGVTEWYQSFGWRCSGIKLS